jgi:hypothetical protein
MSSNNHDSIHHQIAHPHSDSRSHRVENGKLTDLKVTPESRRKDVLIGAE